MRRLRREGVEPYTTVISVEEIWRGIRPGEETATGRMFQGLRLAPLGVEEGVRAGTWRRDHAARGITLHQADCLIAAAAVGLGAPLATANVADFPMEGLRIEDWPTER